MLYVYAALTLTGTLVPWMFLGSFLMEEQFSLAGLLPAVAVNGAAAGCTADLLLSSVAFWLLLLRAGEPKWLLFAAVNLCLGLSAALPAWLCLMELRKSRAPGAV